MERKKQTIQQRADTYLKHWNQKGIPSGLFRNFDSVKENEDIQRLTADEDTNEFIECARNAKAIPYKDRSRRVYTKVVDCCDNCPNYGYPASDFCKVTGKYLPLNKDNTKISIPRWCPLEFSE